MKLKCRPEGRPRAFLVDPADLAVYAEWWFKDRFDVVHNVKAPGQFRLGADWRRQTFFDYLERPLADDDMGWAVVLDPSGSIPNHHLVCARNDTGVEAFDMGIRSEDQLDIGVPNPVAVVTVQIGGHAWQFEGRGDEAVEFVKNTVTMPLEELCDG